MDREIPPKVQNMCNDWRWDFPIYNSWSDIANLFSHLPIKEKNTHEKMYLSDAISVLVVRIWCIVHFLMSMFLLLFQSSIFCIKKKNLTHIANNLALHYCICDYEILNKYKLQLLRNVDRKTSIPVRPFMWELNNQNLTKQRKNNADTLYGISQK